MTDTKVWFITGGGRGLGVDSTKAALAAANAAAATDRTTDAVSKAVGQAEDRLGRRRHPVALTAVPAIGLFGEEGTGDAGHG